MRYAISDIHGCYKTFRALVEEQIQLTTHDALFLLGDYVDRGPSTAALLDYIIQLQEKGYQVKMLRGNHDQMLLDAYFNTSPFAMQQWLFNGGKNTLNSYHTEKIQHIPKKHVQLLRHTEYFLELPDYWLVHAGFNFNTLHWQDDTEAMLWTRDKQYKARQLRNKPIIHGHTPTPLTCIAQSIAQNAPVICIDTGCVYTNTPNLGILTSLCLDSRELYSHKNLESGSKT